MQASARDVDLLPQHFGGDQRDAAFGHVETLAILLRVEPGRETLGENAALVDYAAAQLDVAVDDHIRENDRLFDAAEAVQAHIGEERRPLDHGAADDAPPRHE